MKSSSGRLTKMSGYMLAPIVNAIISFVSIPIITALFPKEVSGQISLFVTYQSIVLSFSLLGMDQSMSRYYYAPPGKMTNKSLTSLCFAISMGAFLTTSVMCFAFWKYLSTAIIGRNSVLIVVCLVIEVLAQLVLRFLNQASRLQDNVRLYFLQSICITLTTKLSYVLVAYTSGSAVDAIIVIVVSSVIIMAMFFVVKAKTTFSMLEKSSSFELRRVFSFGLPQIPVQLLATLNSSVPQLVLGSFLDYTVVGVYSIAVSVSHAIGLIQSGINIVWAPYVYKNYQTNQKMIIRMHHIVSLVMICAGLLLCIFEDLIYLILVDFAYWDSKSYFPLLLISPICYTISETLGIGFKIAEKSYWNILVYSLAFGLNVLLCWTLIPAIGAIGAAIATAASSIVMLIVKSYIGEKYYRCSDSYFKLIFPFVLMSIAVCVSIFFYDSIVRYILFFIALFVTIVMYREEIKYVVQVVFNRGNENECL